MGYPIKPISPQGDSNLLSNQILKTETVCASSPGGAWAQCDSNCHPVAASEVGMMGGITGNSTGCSGMSRLAVIVGT